MSIPLQVRLTQGPLCGHWAEQQVCVYGGGAVVEFHGDVRAETQDGRAVSHLDYEAHESMVQAELVRIVAELSPEFPCLAVAVEHALGVVPVGQRAVTVAVAALHREAAFQGCSQIMDQLKIRVPIWKKEKSRA